METERLDFSQPANDLTAIADIQRKSLIVKNDYKTVKLMVTTLDQLQALIKEVTEMDRDD